MNGFAEKMDSKAKVRKSEFFPWSIFHWTGHVFRESKNNVHLNCFNSYFFQISLFDLVCILKINWNSFAHSIQPSDWFCHLVRLIWHLAETVTQHSIACTTVTDGAVSFWVSVQFDTAKWCAKFVFDPLNGKMLFILFASFSKSIKETFLKILDLLDVSIGLRIVSMN